MYDWMLCVAMILAWLIVLMICIDSLESHRFKKVYLLYCIIPIFLTAWFIKYYNEPWEYETETPVVKVHVIDGQAIAVHNGQVYPLNERTNWNFEDGEEVLFRQQKSGPYLGIYATHPKLLIERK